MEGCVLVGVETDFVGDTAGCKVDVGVNCVFGVGGVVLVGGRVCPGLD
jgi:hypothetical protein